MVSLVGSPVAIATSGLGATTITLPAGAAVGDCLFVFWTAQWNSVNWVEPPLPVNANGLTFGMNVDVSGPDGSNNWGVTGNCFFYLEAADITLGTVEVQAANTTAYDSSAGTYNADPLIGAVLLHNALQDDGWSGLTSFNPFNGDSGHTGDGIGIWYATLWYDASGTDPTTPDLSDFTFARGSDSRAVLMLGIGSFSGAIPGFNMVANASFNTGTTQGGWVSFADGALLLIDSPETLTLAGGAPELGIPLVFAIDTPASLALAGGVPDLTPTVAPATLTIDTPEGLALAGGTPTLTPTTGPASLTIDTPANLALAGGTMALTPTAAAVTITIDTPATLTIAGGTPALTAPNYLGPMLAVLDLEAALSHLYQGLPDSALTGHDSPQLALAFDATVQISSPIFEIAQLGAAQTRLIETIVVTHPVPIITLGRPTLPKYVGYYPSELVCIVGQTDVPPDHIHSIADPDPIWNPETSGWYIQPPASGVGDARWTVQTLPDPSPYSGQYYWLGDPSSEDGTSGIEAGARQWAPDLSTPSAPSWRSKFPYKPSVRAHVNYGASGNILTVTKGVRFNLQYIEHMWAQWGSPINAPFSWVIVGIVMDFPNAGYEHTIMDVGGDPNSYGGSGANINNLGTDHGLTDLGVDYPSRAFMSANVNSQRMAGGLANGETIVSPFNYATRPKMWFGVWDGDTSLGGSYSTAGQYLQAGKMPALSQSHMVIGRRGGILSRNAASHLVIFEMRCWFSALVEEQLDDQYAQLSSTWQFGSYG